MKTRALILLYSLTRYSGFAQSLPVVNDQKPTALCQMTQPNEAVAIVNGVPITRHQLDSAAKRQLAPLNQQINTIRSITLGRLMDNTLIEQAASKASMSVESYLEKEIGPIVVSEADVDRTFQNGATAVFAGILEPEAKYRIRRSLYDTLRLTRLNELLQSLRKGAITRNLLLEGHETERMSFAIDDAASKGPSTAKVTIVEFADFECPACQAAQAEVRRVLERGPNSVRLVYKHFPLEQHPNALSAARASWCAGRQGSFWRFHDLLFEHTASRKALGKATIAALAGELNLEAQQMSICLSSAESTDAVARDYSEGVGAGVVGTPTFFVNNVRVTAAELSSAVAATFQAVPAPTGIGTGGDK